MLQSINKKALIKNIVANAIIAFVFYFIILAVLKKLGEEYKNASFNIIIFIFLFSSFFYHCCKRRKAINIIKLVTLVLIIDFFANNTTISILSLSFLAGSIYYLISNKYNYKNNFIKFILNGFLFLNLLFYYFLIFLYKIDFSIDEGFLLLYVLLYALFIFFIYLSLFISDCAYRPKIDALSTKFFSYIKAIIVFFGLWIILFSLGYWHSMGLFGQSLAMDKFNTDIAFKTIDRWDEGESTIFEHKYLKKEDFIKYLSGVENKNIGASGCLFLLSDNMEWGEKFKNELLAEAEARKFLDAGGSVKAWQYYVSERIYFYKKIIEKNPELFSLAENNIILSWLKDINEYSYKITLADYSYAYLFKQEPVGLYYNQEIGFGMLALFYDLFRDTNPALALKNKQYLDKYTVGWKNNFRNTDDGISYHQNVWIQNAYFLHKYAQIGSLNNAKLSFDWVVNQTPIQSGTHPNYNSLSKDSSINSMLIAASLLNDGKYKYLAENMILNDMSKNIAPSSYIGLDLWDDNVISTQPEIKSYYISGPSGTNAKPKEIKPDKLVLRKIINNKELFILINLRSSGWHRYNGSGSVIMAKYGDKILLQDDIIEKNHAWLPKGKAQHRDKKITNKEIGIWQPESRGMEKLFYYLFSFDDTLKYKNYDKFIYKLEITPDNVKINLDKKNYLFIKIIDNQLKIYYNNENNSLLDYRLY